jgi:hypothetical protein
VFSLFEGYNRFLPRELFEYLHILFFNISFILAYMITYSAIEVDSPSIVIIMKIYKFGSEGVEQEKLENIVNDDLLIKSRLKDLLIDKMAYLENGKFKLTSKGNLLANIFIYYRKLLGTSEGG